MCPVCSLLRFSTDSSCGHNIRKFAVVIYLTLPDTCGIFPSVGDLPSTYQHPDVCPEGGAEPHPLLSAHEGHRLTHPQVLQLRQRLLVQPGRREVSFCQRLLSLHVPPTDQTAKTELKIAAGHCRAIVTIRTLADNLDYRDMLIGDTDSYVFTVCLRCDVGC